MNSINTSVILSTYNSESRLRKVLWSYSVQTYKNFEIVIADDGSGQSTENLVNEFKKEFKMPLTHVWQEDHGFQKSKILNKAIVSTNSEYIIFSDGDCIARSDFVEQHIKNRRRNHFLSGGYNKLNAKLSSLIEKEEIINQKCFDIKWLKKQGLPSSFKNNKITSKGWKARFLNRITPTIPTWNGHNSSGWKDDILKVNGFDERMQYGGQDREMGERLINLGVKAIQIRYTAICLHLDHTRTYKNEDSLKKNREIRNKTKSENKIKTSYGIKL
ncbi:glycosyltransferase family 2 protein [Salegentibacter sp. Hel_I_6]|uniref:glycosyltransferase family 2 protein n=1 Tax=Salegentibacter sp. Hel_I_6 TaxID=1250278 RepID=UPI0005628DFE|nr:glycosyltransferase family 2 protein [Salegentibacter sp. Hel_I_6]